MAEGRLKWKCIKYLISHDTQRVIRRYILKHPIKYGTALVRSLLKQRAYVRDDDFFLYGIGSVQEFKALLDDPETLLLLGFSYCHKPHECPSGRFTTECIHDPTHPVCGQCFIGKTMHLSSVRQAIPLWITTIHYIGQKVFETIEAHPHKKILFLITACEMTLEVFGDLGNMAGIRGIGVRLDGRICNTMKAFELSERGVKPGLTVVLDRTQQRILELLGNA